MASSRFICILVIIICSFSQFLAKSEIRNLKESERVFITADRYEKYPL